ncbi:HD domain-containing protein [Luteolibacter arcticus]|uniref:HD domain-containing protein n=1 Tax=Luteolibacter arcticus TaxID=1581411 RepID=A0ABT3GSA6_9BACT|nr:HD domain-containing protein [Luteolibacter arcticus]MCW1926413.1 HD domain-containing protein [Luteolibacter arcticus]
MKMNDGSNRSGAASEGFTVWQRAANLAAEFHEGSCCPGTETPYIIHPCRVALLVSSVFGCDDPEVLAAALLHDVLEKTRCDRPTLAVAMGSTISEWVEWLSKDPQGSKERYWERLHVAPWQVRMIKMADALDHLNGPAEYLADRLKAARKAVALGDSSSPEPLLQRAREVLGREIERLEIG